MFSDKYELKSLYDNKHEYIRGKRNDSSDGSGASSSTESAFLGPVLWDDTYTINDLDNIDLEEFSPTVLYEASNSSQAWDDVFHSEEMYQSSKAMEVNPSWTAVPNLEPSITQLPPPRPLVTRKKSRVPLEQKNEKYWNRRMRNNASAKRSRDARRMMENQAYAKAALLERENAQLRFPTQINRILAGLPQQFVAYHPHCKTPFGNVLLQLSGYGTSTFPQVNTAMRQYCSHPGENELTALKRALSILTVCLQRATMWLSNGFLGLDSLQPLSSALSKA